MTPERGTWWLAAAVSLIAACAPKSVTPPTKATWDLRGSVVAVSSTRLDVRHKSGRVVALELTDRTELLGTAKKEPRAALVPGTRVAVLVETDASGTYRARSVRVFN